MFLWIRLNSELLRYQGVQNFAKNNTENAELASKMLKQQHLLHQRKNLYNPVSKRSSSDETNTEDNHVRPWQKSFFISPAPYFIPGSVALAGEILQLIGRWNIFYFYHILSAAARLWVWYPPWTKKTQINSRTYSFLSKLTYMLININPQPNIKPPERLTYTLKNTTHSRVSSLLNGYSTRR